MAGAGLITIKRRIRSISSTRKITKAMGLVATTKVQKARRNLLINHNFYSECMDISKEVFENYGQPSIFTKGNGSHKRLLVIFTSERGLCGGFNTNVINEAVKLIGKDKSSVKIMMIGQRGKGYLNKLGYDVSEGVSEMSESPEFKDAESVAQKILKLFDDNEVGEVFTVFTRFISGVKQVVETEKLFPVPFEYDDCYSELVAFEPSINLVMEEALKLYMNEKILYCMLNSSASEYSARMNSMNNATKNADELLEGLKLKYNRVRQGIITQEISEIVGGAGALR